VEPSVAENVCHAWMKYVGNNLVWSFKAAAVEVENKRCSLTFHYRRAHESAGMSETLLQSCRQLTPTPHGTVG